MRKEDLYKKQFELFNPNTELPQVHILGLGTIGSWTSLACAKLGFDNIHIYDFDRVELHNISNQLYTKIGETRKKTEEVKRILEEMTYVDNVVLHEVEFDEKNISILKKTIKKGDIVVMAFDSLEIRKLVFDNIRNMDISIIDGRMGGEVMRIFTLNNNENRKEEYAKTLTYETINVNCGGSSINYNGMIIGGLISSLCKKVVNKQSVPYELAFDINGLGMIVER